MLSFPGSLKVFIAVEPCDMRCSFNGLHQAVTSRLGEDPKSGSIFAFSNKRRSMLKLLYWDGSGLWVLANSHAPQCAYRFVFENPLSVPSALREGL
jgi:transposase